MAFAGKQEGESVNPPETYEKIIKLVHGFVRHWLMRDSRKERLFRIKLS